MIKAPIRSVIRSPIRAVIPGAAIIFIDDFTRPDEDLADSPDWTETDPGGAPTSAAVVSNELHVVGFFDRCYFSPDNGSPNQYTEITLAYTPSGSQNISEGLLRASDDENWIGFIVGNTAITLYRREAGAFNSIGSSAISPVSGDTIRVSAVGDTIEISHNGGAALISVTETFNNTESLQGFNTRNNLQAPMLTKYETGTL